MKPDMQKKGNITKAFVRTTKVKKGIHRPKVSAQKTSELPSQHLSASEPCIETKKEATRREKVIDPSTKIKLQLFPVDEVTRIGLEKDGLNPFLELTLRASKKISSVINHIHTKWGSSKIAATGDPMLLPYESHLRSSRWTSKDTSITAGDVYTSLHSPPIFRLSYGWLIEIQTSADSLMGPHMCGKCTNGGGSQVTGVTHQMERTWCMVNSGEDVTPPLQFTYKRRGKKGKMLQE